MASHPTEAERRELYAKHLAALDAEFSRRREQIRRVCLGDASDTRITDTAHHLLKRAAENGDNFDGNDWAAFVLEARAALGLRCPRCDGRGTKDYAAFAMEPCDNPECEFGRAYLAEKSA
jgi:hypothetical protein